MSSDSPLNPLPNGEAKPNPGLPTVTPPSGGMFFRLFGVPALIVGGLVLALIVAQPLIGKFGKYFLGRTWGSASPEQFLRDLDDANGEVRWRAAQDLAQVLLRDENLASDSAFALQLVQRLHHALDSSTALEKVHAEHFGKLTPKEEAYERKKLEPERNYIQFLIQSLGHFMVPVGVPILKELAVQESGLDPHTLQARRQQALLALGNLGDNLKRFDALSAEQRQVIVAQLEAIGGLGEQAAAAKTALACLKGRQEGQPTTIGVDRVIEKCADAEDLLLRMYTALAATHWSGSETENARIEKALLRLCNDSGKGAEELRKREEENTEQQTRSLVKKPGFDVQAQAALALAHHGWKVRLSLLQAMLDEDELRGIFVVESKKGGAEQPDQALVVEMMLNALKAVAKLHEKDPQRDLSNLRPNLDKLTHNPNPAVQMEAGRVILALNN
jgi:hypothetical protein